MEDIQDGIKTSIQDGVIEDPVIPIFTGKKLLAIGLDYGTQVTEQEITSKVEAKTDSKDIDCVIGTVVGTAVA